MAALCTQRSSSNSFLSFVTITLLLFALSTGYASRSWADEVSPGVKILVTYHSLSGNTERMAEAVAEGAKSVPNTVVVLKRVGLVTAEDLLS